MKIIDKNKDYYDYLQGVFGQDPKAVYLRGPSHVFDENDRPPFLVKSLPDNIVAYQGEIICRCGEVCHYIYFENKGGGVEMEEFFSQKVSVGSDSVPLRLSYSMTAWKRDIPKSHAVHHSHFPEKERFISESIREHTSSPPDRIRRRYGELGPCSPFGYFCGRYSFENPILLSFPITVIPAEKVFIEIQDFLLSRYDDKAVKDGRTDIEKLEAAGFDRKTSFRKIK